MHLVIVTNTLLRIIKLHESLIDVFLVDRDERTLVYLHKHEEKEESLVKEWKSLLWKNACSVFMQISETYLKITIKKKNESYFYCWYKSGPFQITATGTSAIAEGHVAFRNKKHMEIYFIYSERSYNVWNLCYSHFHAVLYLITVLCLNIFLLNWQLL